MRSIYVFGADTHAEWQLIDQVGGAPNRFFQLAQRIAWGITQPDLVRVDVIDNARRLVRSHGSAFPAHLFDAWVWRARDPERGERALERARELVTPDHPLAFLMPSAAEWRVEPIAQRLVEVMPGKIWRIAHPFALAGSPFHHASTATVFRTESGDLALFNPVALSDDTAAAISELGTLRWQCTQGKAHSQFIEPTRRRFPGALALATEGHLSHPGATQLQVDGILGRHPLPAEFELIPIGGHMTEEVVAFHRPTSTLITQDLIAEPGKGAPFLGRLYYFAFGLDSQAGFPSYTVMMWQNVRQLHESLRRIRDTAFTQLATGHGSDDIEAPAAIAQAKLALDRALAISPAGHKLLLGRCFAAQPGFLRDSLRYLRTIKNSVGATMRGGD